jgi:nicotinate-nucleotide adenylyltransferase
VARAIDDAARPTGEAQGGEGSDPSRRRVAIFGGSFNPPHVSHVLAVTYALSTAPIDEVLIVPVFQHPFAKELATFDDRFEMCRLAMGWLPHVSVSDVERVLGGESRTLRTLEHLAETHPDWSLRLLIGADVLADAPKWHRFERVAELAPPIVLGRAGVEGVDAPAAVLPRGSSTEVREALAAGELESLRSWVPARVLDYIVLHRLYGARPAANAV